MSNESKISWSCMNSKEDLLKLFSGHVDIDVIEMMIDNRNNLLLAYRDLMEITKIPNSETNLQLSSNEDVLAATSDLNSPNIINWERLSKNESPTNRILYLVSKGFKVMVLMRGCPGSGKSYQATNILNMCYKNANVDEFIFSADKFFINKQSGGYNYIPSKIRQAHQWALENTKKAVLNEVTPIIIDNTHIEAWEMENSIKMGVNNGYWIEILEPISEWAWEGSELAKRNIHYVPLEYIMNSIRRYDHYINTENFLTRFKLKYSKNNQPPQLSNNIKKYQLHENLLDEKKKIIEPIIANYEHFNNLCISQKQNNYKNENPCTSFNNIDEDPWITNMIQKKEEPVLFLVNDLENLSNDISDINEDCFSTSPFEEASNFTNKSVNTYENDFLFMEVLNEIPEEEYSSYVIFGRNRNINDGNHSISGTFCGKLDKGTITNDELIGIIHKPNISEIRKQFPENVCSLIIELFDKCEGNIDWILDMLFELGHNISKEQLQNVIQIEENNLAENIQVQNTIEKIRPNKQDNDLSIIFPNSKSNTLKYNEDTFGKKKKQGKKVMDTKGKKFHTTHPSFSIDLRKNIENKFTFDDSLYSDHVLNIKKLKEIHNTPINYNLVIPSTSDGIKKDSKAENDPKEKFVQLVIDTSVLAQLCDYFGDFSSDLSKTALPMSVRLPEKLAEDLYYCLIANVPTDICEQEAILKDETLAKTLQEEYKKSTSSNSNSGGLSFAAVLSKQLLLEKFKHFDSKLIMDVLHSNGYKFEESCNILTELSGRRCLSNQDSPNIENEDNYINKVQPIVQNYEQEALKHAHSRQQFLNKANQSLSSKIHPAVTAYYLKRAEESKQNEKHAKNQELVNMIKQNESTTLDLHHFPVKDAILALDIYLDKHISYLKKLNEIYSRGRQLTIITGRGKHSPKGIARIKPVVIQRLEIRRLMYLEPESPGLIMVIIKKNSLLSLEL
ncbi:uncharacterized protein LOC112694641 isoform X1 [Sipha flava]|uniref:Uncharacterized protein LOC112694641 isoform X1 n=1 Tax=Sipha flava TaxID=143950 RepID=A0A8B8GUG2_9HEMI|nr:uncharacterized protein LOC112694641 isoform X1 [Sipha flava]